jgi:hypothetical protein
MRLIVVLMKKPNFFIVGAAKSGTSTLWQHLKQHPAVFMPPNELDKEPAYFSPLKRRRSFDQYLDLFQKAHDRHRRIGEASTAYLTDPASARLIQQFNPESKIIIILRNPADRAYSAYNWMVMEGYEYAWSFRRALHLERKRAGKTIPNYWEPEYYWNYMYGAAGMYYDQVRRFVELFEDNVLIIRFDDFIANLQSEYNRICSFLGVESDDISPSAQNVSRSVYSPVLQFVLRKLSNRLNHYAIKHAGYKITSKQKRDRLLQIGVREKNPQPLSAEFRGALLQNYTENFQKLSELTGTDYTAWLKGR